MQYAVIMAGGSGKRLWPLSRKNRPKQIINLFQDKSLLRHCVDRIAEVFPPERTLVVTNKEYAEVVRHHLPELPAENVLGEPIGRDTANAIGLAAVVLNQRDPDAVMAVFSADQIIEPARPLQNAVRTALAFLETHPHALFTFGIKATYAHTGFGYLLRGERSDELPSGVCPVQAFKEKPNKNTARQYIRSGRYCWNGGMFVWRVDTILGCLERFLPHNADRLALIASAWQTKERDAVLGKVFPELEKISIDYAVMERAKDVYMCELDCHWVDVGSYQALADSIGTIDQEDNVVTAGTSCEWLDSSNNMALSETPDHLIAAIGIENLLIVHTADATLICPREESDRLKDLIDRLGAENRKRFL